MSDDPLKSALEDIAPRLDCGVRPVVAAVLADESAEDAWAVLVQEILDEA